MEYKGIKLTLDMDSKEFESGLKRIKTETNRFDNDIKKLKQNLMFDGKNIEQYSALIYRLNARFSETSSAVSKLKQFLNEGLETGKIAMYSKEWVNLTNTIATLEKNAEITKRNINDLTTDMNMNGKVSKETLEGLNKPLEENKTLWERINDKSDIFFQNLKANLAASVISKGFQLLQSGIEAIWNGLKKLASGYTNLMKQGIEYNALVQGYETSLRTILGDTTGQTEKIISSMQSLGAKYGFGVDTLLESVQNLVVAGVNLGDAQKSVEGFVKALSLAGKGNPELKRVITNLQQIQSNGKATARDLREFANAGIPFNNMLIQYVDGIEEGFEATEVQFEDIVQAIVGATEDVNNAFSKGEELAGKTFNSQINIMQAQWQQLLGAMAEDTTSTLTTEVFPAVNDFLGKMLEAFRGEDGSEGGMGAVVQAFSDNIAGLITKLSDSGVLQEFLNGASQIANAIAEAFDEEKHPENAQALRDAIQSFLDIILNFISDNIDVFVNAGREIGNAIAEGTKKAFADRINSNPFLQEAYDMNNPSNIWDVLFGSGGFGALQSGGLGNLMQSGGFGSLQSGGYNITLNASFVANGNLDEAQALHFADLMVDTINEELGYRI